MPRAPRSAQRGSAGTSPAEPPLPLAAPVLGALLVTCAGPPPAPTVRPGPDAILAAPPPPPPASASFLLIDPDTLPAGSALLLGPELAAEPRGRGAAPAEEMPLLGVLVDGVRGVVDGGALRFAGEVAPSPLTHAARIPAWLGGGFLFRAGTALYTSATFEGPLRPLASLPGSVQSIRFGPRGLFARGSDGERWALAFPSGARLAIDPQGAVDVAAIEDGRAAAITEGGGAAVSADRGASWQDVRGRLGGQPAGVEVIGGELWIIDDHGRGYRVEPGGALTSFDKPPRTRPPKLRPVDPRWRAREAPLRLAARSGALLDARTAVVAAAGDVAWIELPSGKIREIAPGVLPPDLDCEAVEVLPEAALTPPDAPPEEVLFVCGESGRPSVVMSGVVGGEAADEGPGAPGSSGRGAATRLRIERIFPTSGPFYASDDGGLVYAGPCDPDATPAPPGGAAGASAAAPPSPRRGLAACARGPHGQWREHALPREDADAGGPAPEQVRWVPRLDGSPLAIVAGEPPKTHDLTTEQAHAWQLEEFDERVRRDITQDAAPEPRSIGFKVDRRWSAAEDGSVRGWVRGNRAVEVLPGGAVLESPYQFDLRTPGGAVLLVRGAGGRAFQTLDRGRTWVEVGAPAPLLGRLFQVHGCTRVGCDLGAWVRLGWEAPPPAPAPPPAVAAPAPALPLPELRTLSCRPAGEPRHKAAPPTAATPLDQGIGARTLPFTGMPLPGGTGEITYARQVISRSMSNPPHTWVSGEEQAPRAILHGFALEVLDWDATAHADPLAGLTVLGPGVSPRSVRRELSFLEPLDPAGSIRSTTFGIAALAALLRASGAPVSDVLTGSLEAIGVAPVLPADPAGPTEMFLALAPLDGGGVVGVTRGAAVDMTWSTSTPGVPVSAVALPVSAPGGSSGGVSGGVNGGRGAAAGLAALWLDDSGAARVTQLAGGAMTPLFELPAPPSSAEYPANPDALAVGPHGELAILRTPSAGEPPSAEDPALLFPAGGGLPRALAPWSTLTSAADPACRESKEGYRAIVQTARPWLRAGHGEPAEEMLTPMMARVRWSEVRVCLEAVELPARMTAGPGGTAYEVVTVARLSPPAAAADLTVGVGQELRLPLACTLSPAPAGVAPSPAGRP